MFIPESAMGGLPSAAAASSLGFVEQVARHYAVGKQLSKERVSRLALTGESRVAQLIRWVNEDDRGAPASESITAEAVLRAQRGSFEVYEMLDRKQQLLVMKGVLRLQGTSCTEVLSLLSAKEPSEVDAMLEDLLGAQLYSASTCLYHTDVDMARVKREASKTTNTRANVPPAGPQAGAGATAPVKTSMAVQWMAVKDVAGSNANSSGKALPLREFFFMRFNQSFATAAPTKDKRPRVSYGVSVWESIDLPTCVPLFPTSQMRRRTLKNCGFVVEASETPGSDTTRVSFFVTASFDPATADRDSEWLLRVAEGALNVPSALVNRRIRRNQLRDRRHWAYANACAVCNAKFGMLSKKHHCRICGGTVCGKCSEMRTDLRTSVLTASARVCRGCLRGDSLTPWSSSSASNGSFDLSERGSMSSVSSWTEFSSRGGGNGRTLSDSTRGSVTSSTYSDGGDNRDRSWSMESFGSLAHVAEPTFQPPAMSTTVSTPSSKTIRTTSSSSDRANTGSTTSPPPMKAVRSVSQEVASKPTAVPRTKLYRSISTQDGASAPTHHRSASHDNYPVPAYQAQPPQMRAAKLERKASTTTPSSGNSTPSSTTATSSRATRGVSSAAALSSTPVTNSRSTRGVSSAAAMQSPAPVSSRSGSTPKVSAPSPHKSARSFSHDGSSVDSNPVGAGNERPVGFTVYQTAGMQPPAPVTSRGGKSPKVSAPNPHKSARSFSNDGDSNLVGSGSERAVGFTVYQVPGANRRPTRGRSPTSSNGSGSTGGGLTPRARPVSPAAARSAATTLLPPHQQNVSSRGQPAPQQHQQPQRPMTAMSPANKTLSSRFAPATTSAAAATPRGRDSPSSSTSSSPMPSPPAAVGPIASVSSAPIAKAGARNGTSRPRQQHQPETEPPTSTKAASATEWGYELSYAKGNPWPDAPMPPTEAERLERIKTLNLSQHFTNTELRELLQFACTSIQCPVGAVSVVAVSTSLLVTTIGLRGDQLPRDLAPDAHVLMSREPTVVLDTQRDPRFAKNPLVASTNMRFFLGVPLIVKDSGVIVGALNLIDTSPRESVKPSDLKALEVVASRIINKMDSRNSDSSADDQTAAPRTGVLLF